MVSMGRDDEDARRHMMMMVVMMVVAYADYKLGELDLSRRLVGKPGVIGL